MWELQVSHEATSGGCPELNLRNAELPSDFNGETHNPIGHDTGHGREAVVGGVKPGDKVPKGLDGVFLGVIEEFHHTLGGIRVGRRDAVRDGLEPESGEVLDRGRALGPEEATVVEFGVNKGDEEAMGVKEFG